MNREQLDSWMESGAVDTVILAFPDVFGRLSGKRFTADYFRKAVAEHGSHACSYLLTLNLEQDPWEDFPLANWEKGFGDFHIMPDFGAVHLLPWAEKTALVFADVFHADHRPVAEAPRQVLRAALERLAGEGLACFAASELEFFLYEEDARAAFASGYRNLTPSSDHRIDYDILQTARDEPVIREARQWMPVAGVPVENSKGEWGRGQHELNFTYGAPLPVADRHIVFKHGMKDIARRHGRLVTFMAKPFAHEAGSSCHIHMSLLRDGRNVFWDEAAGGGSREFRGFLGGLLRYAREFALLYAPTVNSYKRFQSLSWAPTRLVWAADNRTVGFRVVSSGQSFRVENRMPGADANPYLAFAGMIASGLAGMREGLDCGEPYRGNAYADASLPSLPSSLEEAAELFESSAAAREAFGGEVVDFLVRTARHEAAEFRQAVTDWERARYLERI